MLGKFTPKQNLNIPPLKYDIVYRLKKEFPDEEIIINGGINSIYQIKNHLEKVDGVMIGRTAYHSPYFLAEIEKEIFNNHNIPSRTEVIERMFPYIKEEASKGTRLNQIMRHTIGLFHGQKGSADWKRYLSKNMCIREADLQKVNHIMDHIKNNGSTTSLGR
jgi:tRNA-dihydrouridine synthase A